MQSLFTSFRCFLFFLALAGSLSAYQEIPEPLDPEIFPLTFLQQERSVVFQRLRHLKLIGNENILHLGCRDGYLSNEIAKYLPEGNLVGLENVYAEQPQVKSDNVSYFQGKFVEQGWENLYDYIICTQFDEWDDDPDKLFDAIRKALKPGGKAIILICTDCALPAINPLEDWLIKSENQEYAPFLRFWSNIDCSKLRTLKYPDFRSVYGKLTRMISFFRGLEQFREESRKWFRKIASLPMPLQDVALNHLVTVAEKDGTYHLDEEDFYTFYYKLEVACRQKAE
jgi:SAM-dependent methyltransferase